MWRIYRFLFGGQYVHLKYGYTAYRRKIRKDEFGDEYVNIHWGFPFTVVVYKTDALSSYNGWRVIP